MSNRAERRRYKHPQRTPGFTPVGNKHSLDLSPGEYGEKLEQGLFRPIPRKLANRRKRAEITQTPEPSIEQA